MPVHPPPATRSSGLALASRRVAAWLLLPGLASGAAAQKAEPDPPGGGTVSQSTRVEAWVTAHPHGQAVAEGRLSQRLTWQDEAAPGQGPGAWRASVSWQAQADTRGLAHGVQGASTHRQTRPALALEDAYLQHTVATGAGQWRMRLGRQTVDWATTDTVSPLDALNPRDWSDLSRVRKRPLPALSLQWSGASDTGAPSTAEWVATPGGQALLPQGAWADALPAGVALRPTRPPDHQLGLRLTTQAGETDLSAVAYRGPALSPSATLAADGPGSLVLQPAHDTVHLWGVALTRPVAEGSLLRLEWARQRQARGDDFDTLVASVDHEWNGLLHPRDTLHLLLQGQWEHVRRTGQPQPPGWWDFRRVFQHHALLRLQYQPVDPHWQWTLEATLHPATRQRYARLAAQHRLNPSWQLHAGLVQVKGERGSFWGGHRNGRQAFAGLVWTP